MAEKLFTTVVLDVPRRIRFSNRAVQRVGELDHALSLADLRSKKRAQAALIQWLWGCLIGEDAAAFATPEDLADALPFPLPADRQADMMTALLDAWNLAQPRTEKKKRLYAERAFARIELGLTDDEYLDMAPAQYTEMRKAWHAREKRTQERFAMLALVSAKCAGNKDKSLNDFMGAFAEDDE